MVNDPVEGAKGAAWCSKKLRKFVKKVGKLTQGEINKVIENLGKCCPDQRCRGKGTRDKDWWLNVECPQKMAEYTIENFPKPNELYDAGIRRDAKEVLKDFQKMLVEMGAKIEAIDKDEMREQYGDQFRDNRMVFTSPYLTAAEYEDAAARFKQLLGSRVTLWRTGGPYDRKESQVDNILDKLRLARDIEPRAQTKEDLL